MPRTDDGIHRGLEIVGALIVVVAVVSTLLQGALTTAIACGMRSAVGGVVGEAAEDCDDQPVATAALVGSDTSGETGLAADEITSAAKPGSNPTAAGGLAGNPARENAAEQDHPHDIFRSEQATTDEDSQIASSWSGALPTTVADGQLDVRNLLAGRSALPGQDDRLVVGLSDWVYSRAERSDIIDTTAQFAVPAVPADVYEDGVPLAPGGDPVTADVEQDYAALLRTLPDIVGAEAAARFATCRYPSVVVGDSTSTSEGIFNRGGVIFIERDADPETRYAVLAHEFAHALYICAGNVGLTPVNGTNQGGGVNEAQAYYFGNLAAWHVDQKPFSPNYGSFSFCDGVDPTAVHQLARPVTGVFIDLERQLDLQVGAGETQRRMGLFHAGLLLSDDIESFVDLRTQMYAVGAELGITRPMVDAAFGSLDFETWAAGRCADGYGPRGLLRPGPAPGN